MSAKKQPARTKKPPKKRQPVKQIPKKRRIDLSFWIVVILILVAFGFGVYHKKTIEHAITPLAKAKVSVSNVPTPLSKAKVSVPAAPINYCSGNSLSQLIIVSIAEQQVWACADSSQVYSTPVITGMENYPADLTPTGTYHIYEKETDQYLTGCDTTGCWNDYVYYWMPFLSNRYGIYGFHDATWRPNSAFGNTSIYSDSASHGCVEMPLAAAAWLYNWAQIGATLTIED